MMIINDMPEVHKHRFFDATKATLVRTYGFSASEAERLADQHCGSHLPDGRDSPASFAKRIATYEGMI